jgi:hypothetical protein
MTDAAMQQRRAANQARWPAKKRRKPNKIAELSDERPGHSLRRFVGIPSKTTENPNKTGQNK